MYIKAKLVFESYIPDSEQPLKGLLFKKHRKDVIYGKIYEYDYVYREKENIYGVNNQVNYLESNGYPVKPCIVSITANPDDKAAILATAEQIGWWNDGPEYDELRDIEIEDMNGILDVFDGEIYIEIKDHMFEQDIVETTLYEGQVTLSFMDCSEDYEHEEYEDGGGMDDITDYDADHETE